MTTKLSTRSINKSKLFIYEDDNPQLSLGLCCINNTLRKQKIYCSRTVIRKNYTVDKAKSLAKQNLLNMKKVLEWNVANNIYHYRMSSDMFPRFTDTEVECYTLHDFAPMLKELGDYCKEHNISVSMHPGQYNQIGAERDCVYDSTIADLEHHAEIMDFMDVDGIICIHGGGIYGDKEKTIKRWIDKFHQLPDMIKRRIAIENCELQYNIEDCLYIANKCNIPVIFDIHHFNCYNQKYSLDWKAEKYIPYVLDTWGENRIPVFHISDQRDDARLGAHHDFVECLPDCFLDIVRKYHKSAIIEIEAKAKEQAILKLYKTHSDLLNTVIKYD